VTCSWQDKGRVLIRDVCFSGTIFGNYWREVPAGLSPPCCARFRAMWVAAPPATARAAPAAAMGRSVSFAPVRGRPGMASREVEVLDFGGGLAA